MKRSSPNPQLDAEKNPLHGGVPMLAPRHILPFRAQPEPLIRLVKRMFRRILIIRVWGGTSYQQCTRCPLCSAKQAKDGRAYCAIEQSGASALPLRPRA